MTQAKEYETEGEEFLPLSRSQKGKITRVRANIEKAQDYIRKGPVPPFSECFPFDCMPDGKTRLEADEAGDWTPYWCDDCGTWHKTASALDFDPQGEVMEGTVGPVIEARTVDEDGNWDFDSASFEGDLEWAFFYRTYVSSDQYFIGWAQYHLWCAEHNADPLEEWVREYATRQEAVDANIKAAQTQLAYVLRTMRQVKPKTA